MTPEEIRQQNQLLIVDEMLRASFGRIRDWRSKATRRAIFEGGCVYVKSGFWHGPCIKPGPSAEQLAIAKRLAQTNFGAFGVFDGRNYCFKWQLSYPKKSWGEVCESISLYQRVVFEFDQRIDGKGDSDGRI